jgi:hypothetical protein
MITLGKAVLVLELFVVSQGAASMEFEFRARALMRVSEYDGLKNALRDLKTLSELRKIFLVDALSEMLADNTKVRLDGYVFQDSEPDLRVVAGRAQWFIDEIMLLPRQAENSVRNTNERIKIWKASVASRRTVTPKQVEMLRTKYAGKIHIGIAGGKAYESIENFDKFLEEWFPYGKSLQEMEAILDVKLPVERGDAVLRIDSGFNGLEYRFLQEGGTIHSVKISGID